MKPDTSLRLGFDVPELEKLIELLKKDNVEILKEPTFSAFGYSAIIRDVDGRKIELKAIKPIK